MSRIARWRSMPLSRKLQYLSFLWARCITATYYKHRLRSTGKNCIVQTPLFWTPEFISLGDNVLIWKGCRIECVDRYGHSVFQPHIVVGDRVSFQQNCHVTAAGELVIESDTSVLYGVLITDIDHRYDTPDINVAEQPLEVRKTHIGKHCFIGAGAKIQAGSQLGDHCIVGTNAVVRGIFPSHCVIAGVPGRIVKRFDAIQGQWRKTNPAGEFLPSE